MWLLLKTPQSHNPRCYHKQIHQRGSQENCVTLELNQQSCQQYWSTVCPETIPGLCPQEGHPTHHLIPQIPAVQWVHRETDADHQEDYQEIQEREQGHSHGYAGPSSNPSWLQTAIISRDVDGRSITTLLPLTPLSHSYTTLTVRAQMGNDEVQLWQTCWQIYSSYPQWTEG